MLNAYSELSGNPKLITTFAVRTFACGHATALTAPASEAAAVRAAVWNETRMTARIEARWARGSNLRRRRRRSASEREQSIVVVSQSQRPPRTLSVTEGGGRRS